MRKPDGSFSDTVRHFDWRIIFRARTLLYMGVWSAVGVGLIVALLTRDRLELNVLHDRNPQYVLESDGSIRNGYSLRVLNMVPRPRDITVSIDGLPDATMKVNGLAAEQVRSFTISAAPDEVTALKVFVTLPGNQVGWETEEFSFVIKDAGSDEQDSYTAYSMAQE